MTDGERSDEDEDDEDGGGFGDDAAWPGDDCRVGPVGDGSCWCALAPRGLCRGRYSRCGLVFAARMLFES